ncbi:hypothetical protein CHUAL_005482 [Chamberlinius hualienensis]
MSSRYYPIFIKGNPQLRIFLPNFWMKIAKPKNLNVPANTVPFIISMEMTKLDVRNYLEKIYKIPVVDVRTVVYQGKFKREESRGYIIKDEDQKWAFVKLPADAKFIFPDLFPNSAKERDEKDLKMEMESHNHFQKKIDKNADLPGVPMWFGRL